MQTTMDGAGRLIIPEDIRRQAGLEPGTPLDVRWHNGRIEIEAASLPVTLVRKGRFMVAAPHGEHTILTSQVDALAEVTGRSRSFLIAEAIDRYLADESWQIAKIQEGIADADAGRVYEDDEVQAEMRQIIQVRISMKRAMARMKTLRACLSMKKWKLRTVSGHEGAERPRCPRRGSPVVG